MRQSSLQVMKAGAVGETTDGGQVTCTQENKRSSVYTCFGNKLTNIRSSSLGQNNDDSPW